MSLSGFFGSWAMLISRLALTWRVETYSHRNENIFLRGGFGEGRKCPEPDRGNVLNTTGRRIGDRYRIGTATACPKPSQDVSPWRRRWASAAHAKREALPHCQERCEFRRAVRRAFLQ